MPANVVVPEVGESIVDARVAKWLKKEGDAVNVGDALVELETDKIDLEVAAPQAGVLGRITQGDGADVKVGDVIGVIEDGRGARGSGQGRGTLGTRGTGSGCRTHRQGAGAQRQATRDASGAERRAAERSRSQAGPRQR